MQGAGYTHWLQQGSGRLQELCTPAHNSKVEREHKNGNCQCLHSQRVSQQIPTPPADPLRLANESLHKQSRHFLNWCFCAGSLGQVNLHVNPKRTVSQFFVLFGSPVFRSHCFSKLDILGAHLSGTDPNVGCLLWGTSFLLKGCSSLKYKGTDLGRNWRVFG